MHTTRIGIINMLEHSSIGTASIFVPILVNVLTGSYIMAGVTVGSYALVQVLSYIYFGRLSDKRREMIRFVRIGFLASAVVFYMHALAYDGLTFFAIRLAAGMTTGIYAGALLALAYEKGRNE
jgi:MFS family permease